MCVITLDRIEENIKSGISLTPDFTTGRLCVELDLNALPKCNNIMFVLGSDDGRLVSADIVKPDENPYCDDVEEVETEQVDDHTFVEEEIIDWSERQIPELEIPGATRVEKKKKRGRPKKNAVTIEEPVADSAAEEIQILIDAFTPVEEPETEVVNVVNETVESNNEQPDFDEYGYCESCEEVSENESEETEQTDDKHKKVKKPKVKYARKTGHLVKQIPTPTCTGNLAPTLMATGYGTATYKNFYSVGHFPKLGILEVWEDDERVYDQPAVSEPTETVVEREMNIDINDKQDVNLLDAASMVTHNETVMNIEPADDKIKSQIIIMTTDINYGDNIRKFGQVKKSKAQLNFENRIVPLFNF